MQGDIRVISLYLVFVKFISPFSEFASAQTDTTPILMPELYMKKYSERSILIIEKLQGIASPTKLAGSLEENI